MTVPKWVGGTLAAAGMANMVVYYDERPHPHQDGPPDRPTTELTRPQYEVSSSAAGVPPGRTLISNPRFDEYHAAWNHAVQTSAQMTKQRNAALYAAADGYSATLLY